MLIGRASSFAAEITYECMTFRREGSVVAAGSEGAQAWPLAMGRDRSLGEVSMFGRQDESVMSAPESCCAFHFAIAFGKLLESSGHSFIASIPVS